MMMTRDDMTNRVLFCDHILSLVTCVFLFCCRLVCVCMFIYLDQTTRKKYTHKKTQAEV